MSPERWQQVKGVLDSALELDAGQREEYIAQICGEDFELAAEVRALITAQGQADDPIENGGTTLPIFPTGLHQGRRIGPYLLIEVVGEGGMGVVYRAVRADHVFNKQVAIKLVKRGLDIDFVHRRFRHERQVLAALEHPNIARILDGGTTDDGLPYFVMEFIEGQRIDAYSDSNQLTTEKRLELIRTVCQAVHYAHQKHIVHRDIKPNNILITREGVLKLLDFGIAKILNPENSTGGMDSTATAFRLMTPEYASPEQLRGEAITAATDIYSLGVLAYELLTGRHPFRFKSRAPHEIAQVICNQEPESLRTAIRRPPIAAAEQPTAASTITVEAVSAARSCTVEQLRSRLSGDLDKIVRMAMRKEPERRYASAEELADDIRRYLEGLPVKARKGNFAYRGVKFLRRHRIRFMAAALALTTLMLGILAWQNRASKAALSGGWKARRSVAVLGFRNLSGRPEAAWLSTTFSELLATELAAGEKIRTVPGEAVVHLKATLALADAETLAKPTLSRIRNNLGADYVVLGSFLAMGDRPDSMLRLDVRLQDAAAGETVFSSSESGKQADLLKLVAQSGTRLRERLGAGASAGQQVTRASQPANPLAARYYAEGISRFRQYRTIEARDLLERAIQADPRHALSHSALALTLGSLGLDARGRSEAKKAFELSANLQREDRLYIEGRYREMIRDWNGAVGIYKTLWGFFPDNLDYGLRLSAAQISAGKEQDAMVTIAALRKLPPPASADPRIDLDEADAAAAAFDFKRSQLAAADAARKGSAQKSWILVARSLLTESRALEQLGKPAEAIAAVQEGLRIYEQTGHRRGVTLALSANARILTSQGDISGAIRLYEQALSICREIGHDDGEAAALNNIGLLLREQGRLDNAQRVLEEALVVRRKNNDRFDQAQPLGALAAVLADKGDLEAARELYEQSLAIYRENGQRRGQARILQNLALLLRWEGKLPAANMAVEESLVIRRELGDDAGSAMARYADSRLLEDDGDLAAARKGYEEALAIKRKQGDKRAISQILIALGHLSMSEGNLAVARWNLEEALVLRSALRDAASIAESRTVLAGLALEEGRAAAAEEFARQAIAEFQKEGATVYQAMALEVLARCLAAGSRTNEAQHAIARAESLVRNSAAKETQLVVAITGAKLRGSGAGLHAALNSAVKLSFLSYTFDARLALGELEMRSDAARGRAHLAMLEKDADARGFKLVARKAAALMAGRVKNIASSRVESGAPDSLPSR